MDERLTSKPGYFCCVLERDKPLMEFSMNSYMEWDELLMEFSMNSYICCHFGNPNIRRSYTIKGKSKVLETYIRKSCITISATTVM